MIITKISFRSTRCLDVLVFHLLIKINLFIRIVYSSGHKSLKSNPRVSWDPQSTKTTWEPDNRIWMMIANLTRKWFAQRKTNFVSHTISSWSPIITMCWRTTKKSKFYLFMDNDYFYQLLWLCSLNCFHRIYSPCRKN